MSRRHPRASGAAIPQRPKAFLDGGFVLPVVALWIVCSSSRYFGLPAFAGIPQVTGDRLCLIVLLGYAFVMIGIRKPRLRTRVAAEIILWVLACLVAFSGYAYGSFGPYPETQVYVFNAFVYPAVALSLVLRCRLTERDVARFVALLTCFGLYLGITAVLERFNVHWALIPAAIGDPSQGIHYGRARGPFLQAAFDGAVMVMLLPVAMLLLQLSERRWRVLGTITIMLLCVGTYLTSTRAAMMGLGAVLVAGGFLRSPGRRNYRILTAVLGVIGVLLVLSGAPLVPRFEEPTSSRDRYDLAIATGEMILTHPIAGVGYGNFDALEVEFFNKGQHFGWVPASNEKFWDGGSHNSFLTPFAELGILVGCLNIGLLLTRLVVGLRPLKPTTWANTRRHPVIVTGGLMVIAFLINGLLVEMRYTATPNLLLWSFAALVERYWWILGATPAMSTGKAPAASNDARVWEPAGAA